MVSNQTIQPIIYCKSYYTRSYPHHYIYIIIYIYILNPHYIIYIPIYPYISLYIPIRPPLHRKHPNGIPTWMCIFHESDPCPKIIRSVCGSSLYIQLVLFAIYDGRKTGPSVKNRKPPGKTRAPRSHPTAAVSLGRDPRHVDGVPHSPGRSQQLGALAGAANCARHCAGDDGLGDPLDLRAPEIRLESRNEV